MAEWPSSLPAIPLRQDYTERFAETRVRTQMDAGRPKVRNRFRAGSDEITISILLTDQETAIFSAFYKNTLDGGALPFDYIHPRTREQRSFSFVSPPDIVPAEESGAWFARMNLEYVGSTEALAFVDLDFTLPGNSGYIPLIFEDI